MVGLVVLVMLLLAPASAHAKGIPFIWNTGQETFRTGPLPEPFDKDPELKGFEAGYLCDINGVMWSYFSVSNCKPVAFKGNTFDDEPELAKAIAAKYPESSMDRGIWGRFGWMILALGAVIGAGIWAKEFFTGKGDDDDSSQDESKDKAA